MAVKHLNKCSISLSIREKPIRTTLRFILYLSDWLSPIAQVISHADEDVEQVEHPSTAGESANYTSSMEIKMSISQKDETKFISRPS